jgi:hypothetical protein
VLQGTVSLKAPIKGVSQLSVPGDVQQPQSISQDELAHYRHICDQIAALQERRDGFRVLS